jgi:hypothetical protein
MSFEVLLCSKVFFNDKYSLLDHHLMIHNETDRTEGLTCIL